MQFPSIGPLLLEEKTFFFLIRNLLLQPIILYVNLILKISLLFLRQIFFHYTIFFTAHDDFYNYFFGKLFNVFALTE